MQMRMIVNTLLLAHRRPSSRLTVINHLRFSGLQLNAIMGRLISIIDGLAIQRGISNGNP